MHGAVIMSPGLHKRTGSWCQTVGIWSPVIYVDPQMPTFSEANFMIQHEICHAQERHALWGLVLCSVFPVLFWVMYPHYRRWCEIRADRSAVRYFGSESLRIYCHMRKHPTSRWGRFLYGKTKEARVKRTLKGMKGIE